MLHRFFSGPWAMEPRLHDRLAPLVLSGRVDLNAAKLARDRRSPRFEIVALDAPTKNAVGSGSAYRYLPKLGTKEGVVPIIPVIGTMTRYGDMCSYGTEDISAWILEAENDRSVVGMVLEIDSGGGEVNGTELLAEVVRQSSKPVVAYVTGMAASAAYWVASATQWIVMESATASEVGSIGVLSMHVDMTKALEKQGMAVTIIRAEGSENKALYNSVEPIDAAMIAAVRAEMKPIREAFEDSVRAGRPNISDKVFESKGGMFPASKAVGLGMADEIGFLGNAVAKVLELAQKGE
ncbi:S49 family peptidase [Arundinibacter roseus]|uniref:S49 family peptidase n=1 Tax=Arundinibacter roseus TaxID=2070510 RepID=A0A4R4K9E2_9BACT|nr:S49 family peptidase [Arundinibacter roseus]TDB64394.1 S49 family peptidase [Arundinibacter roseus]